MVDILVVHGPNLNMLGKREPDIYGSDTLADIDNQLHQQAKSAGYALQSIQSNAEHTLITRIHDSMDDGTKYIIINPAAFTHTSIAIRDALLAVNIPFVEVHLSNIYQREAFRKQSYFSDKAQAVISGCGAQSYALALSYVLSQLTR